MVGSRYIQIDLRLAVFSSNITTYSIAAVCLVIIFVSIATTFAISQVPDTTKYGVKITYPTDGQMVPVGELTIFGTATYNATISDCTVYADWNGSHPCKRWCQLAQITQSLEEQIIIIQLGFSATQISTI